MSLYFLQRPIFACVLAFALLIGGAFALSLLPVAQFPDLSPPRIEIDASYPGATAELVATDVASIIEEGLDGADGLQYYETSTNALGELEVDAVFAAGTNADLASVDVQNRLKRIEPRLPRAVVQQGISVSKTSNSFLMLVALTSTDGNTSPVDLGDLMSRMLLRELRRAPGVGSAHLWDPARAMRIWLDPMKLHAYKLSTVEVNAAIAAQNASVAAGTLGDAPLLPGQAITASVTVRGELATPEEFGAIVLRTQTNGAVVYLRDVARIALGQESYAFGSRLNGRPAATVGIRLAPRGNALATSAAIRAILARAATSLPPGVAVSVPFDASRFVGVAIKEVVWTLAEAVVLVFFVMWLFLGSLRAALVPTVVIPVALAGAFVMMYLLGYSINVLTLFGLVLSIGILVDDAIVVVENVDRILREQAVTPLEATVLAMRQIGGAVVGVTAVLVAVFVPMLFFPGAVGGVYRQFGMAILTTMLISALMALTLTPALCAVLLRRPAAHAGPGRFERGLTRVSARYERVLRRMLSRPALSCGVYLALCGVGATLFVKLPQGFLPVEDQAQMQVMVQLPAGATLERTAAVVQRVEGIVRSHRAVADMTSVLGWSFEASGQNVAMVFVQLRDWEARVDDAATLRDVLNTELLAVREADLRVQLPPSISGVGHADGLTLRLEDRGGVGLAALEAARGDLFARAAADPVLADVHSEAPPDAPRIVLDIDRVKAAVMGVAFADIADMLATHLGSNYLNDFPAGERMQRVIIAADASARMNEDDLLRLSVRNARQDMVPLASFATLRWSLGPTALTRYNGYPSVDIRVQPAPGHSTGAAIAELERLAATLPTGVAWDWTDQAAQQRETARLTPLLLGLSLLAVFMALAALYESLTIPLAVLLVVPLGVAGAAAAMLWRGLPADIYFRIGVVTVIGLTGKNAILIVQFARELRARGLSVSRAVRIAARTRFRPVVMTSFAFLLGVLPLALSSGAGAQSRRSIGTAVSGGIVAATVLGLLFTPLAFYLVSMPGRRRRSTRRAATSTAAGAPATQTNTAAATRPALASHSDGVSEPVTWAIADDTSGPSN